MCSTQISSFPVLQWEMEQQRSLEERGRLLLCLQFLPPNGDGDLKGEAKERARGGLCVGVKRCAHLAAMDVNGFSDPYVKTWAKTKTETVLLPLDFYSLRHVCQTQGPGTKFGRLSFLCAPLGSKGTHIVFFKITWIKENLPVCCQITSVNPSSFCKFTLNGQMLM